MDVEEENISHYLLTLFFQPDDGFQFADDSLYE
jgi:hypothetical protein